MTTETFFYETLTPVALSTAPDSRPPSPPQQQPESNESEPCTVFKHEISAAPLHSPTKTAAAPEDYFSLDVNLDNDDLNGFLTPSIKPVKSSEVVEPERTLESGWFRGNSRYESPMLQLHKEILDFCDFLSPTPEEQSSRSAAVESVFDVIRYIWPNCRVEVFGSFKTGLYLPSSDIDVVILGSDIRTPQTGLHALSRALSQRGVAKKIQVIAKARVPIIKFIEKKSGIAFDISFDVDNGPKAAEFIKDAISKLPALRPLCLILKIFLQQRELNEVYSGGIGSYALLVMIIAMLQNHWKSQTYPQHNLGILLVNFFEFYGRKLNTWDVGVSCRKSGTFYSKSKRGFLVQGRPFLISIEDPQTPENDIGKNSFNYFQIKSAFTMALSTLTNARTIMDLGPHRSILGTIIRPDAVLLERKGGSNGEMTFNNLLPGAGEPLEPQYEKQQGLVGNWLLGADEEEEPLPRSNGFIAAGSTSPRSSGKKRKSSKEKFKNKLKENGNGNGVLIRHRENGSRKDKSAKKKRRRESR